MNYRIQDFMRLIIPGLYVVALVTGGYLLLNKEAINLTIIKDLTSIIVLFIPFVGFYVGYCIECIMSLLEHSFYRFGGRRPSKTLLEGGYWGTYIVCAKEKIRAKHNVSENITNAKANEILQTAKQEINKKENEDFWYNSILARNIFGGQIILTFIYFFHFSLDIYGRVFIIMSVIFLIFWFHQTHVYVKYILSEYGKKIEKTPSN